MTLRELDAVDDPIEFYFRKVELEAGIMHQSQAMRDKARVIAIGRKIADAEATIDVTHETYRALVEQLDEVRELLREQVRYARFLSELFELLARRAGVSADGEEPEATALPPSSEVA